MYIANKRIYYALAVLAAIWMLLHHFTPIKMGLVVAVLSLASIPLAIKVNNPRPATYYLPFYLLVDVIVWLVVHCDRIIESYDENGVSNVVSYELDSALLFIMVMICAAALLGSARKERLAGLVGVASACLGALVIMSYTGGSYDRIPFGGRAILACFLLFAGLLSICLQASSAVEKRSGAKLFIVAALVGFAPLVLFILFPPFVVELSYELSDFLLGLPGVSLSPLAVGILFIVLCVLSFVMFQGEGEGSTAGVDSVVTFFFATLALAARMAVATYFTHSWILLVAFVVSGLWCINNESRGKRSLGLSSHAYLLANTAVFLFISKAVAAGLAPCVVIAAVFGLIAVARIDKLSLNSRSFWLGLMAFVGSEIVALLVLRHASLDSMVLFVSFVLIGLVSLSALFVCCRDARPLPASKCLAICCCVAAVGLLAAKPSMEIRVEQQGKGVAIAIEDLADEGQLPGQGGTLAALKDRVFDAETGPNKARITWKDAFGNDVSKRTISIGGGSFPLEGEALIIEASSKNGAKTTSTFYFPYWLEGVQAPPATSDQAGIE